MAVRHAILVSIPSHVVRIELNRAADQAKLVCRERHLFHCEQYTAGKGVRYWQSLSYHFTTDTTQFWGNVSVGQRRY
jgi:hypothetical protein